MSEFKMLCRVPRCSPLLQPLHFRPWQTRSEFNPILSILFNVRTRHTITLYLNPASSAHILYSSTLPLSCNSNVCQSFNYRTFLSCLSSPRQCLKYLCKRVTLLWRAIAVSDAGVSSAKCYWTKVKTNEYCQEGEERRERSSPTLNWRDWNEGE